MSEFEIIHIKGKGFTKREIDSPPSDVKEGILLVRPLRVGICGSDVNYLEACESEEICIGHEWVGRVELAPEKSNYKKGDLISSGSTIGCGVCVYCKKQLTNYCLNALHIGFEDSGMMRSWALIPEKGVASIPKDLDLGAATLLEVAAVGDEAIRCLQRLTDEKNKLLIFGAGPVGIFTALRAQELGYSFELIEIEPFRLKKALELGLPAISLAQFLVERRRHYDLLIDCSGDDCGKKGLWQYLEVIAGKAMKGIIVGKYSDELRIDIKTLSKRAVTLHWMSGVSTKHLAESIDHWSPKIEKYKDAVISYTLGPDAVDEALTLARSRKDSLKIIISIQN